MSIYCFEINNLISHRWFYVRPIKSLIPKCVCVCVYTLQSIDRHTSATRKYYKSFDARNRYTQVDRRVRIKPTGIRARRRRRWIENYRGYVGCERYTKYDPKTRLHRVSRLTFI